MYSKHHFALSVAAAAGLIVGPGTGGYPSAALLAYAAFLGVAIDLDHFVIARLRTGTWAPLRWSVTHPVRALLDQEGIFERGQVGTLTRLLSHALVGGAIVGGLAAVDAYLAAFTAVILYAHVVSDLAWDAWAVRTGRALPPSQAARRYSE